MASDLVELRHPEARLVIFNSQAQGRVWTGFLASEFNLSDLELGPSVLQSFCSPGAIFESQSSATPFWRVNRVQYRKGLVSIRASSVSTITCVKPSTSELTSKNLSFVAEADSLYVTAITPNQMWWVLPSELVRPSLRTGYTESAAELITINRSFHVLSISRASPKISAGQEWKTRIVLQSFDGRRPSACQVYVSGARWSYQQALNLPATAVFQKCFLTDLGESKWQLDASTLIPANAQPDFFSVALIRLNTGDSDRFAIPRKPVYEEVENPSATRPLEAASWHIQGLEPLKFYSGRRIFNSFSAELNKPFWLEVDFRGPQAPTLGYLQLNLLIKNGASPVLVPRTLRADQPDEIFLRSETERISDGTRLRFQLRLPRLAMGNELQGFHLSRFYSPTSDFSWSELETPTLSDAWIIERGSIQ